MAKTSFLDAPRNLYEFPLLRRITGNTLRPGGLKVTARALELCEFSHGAKLLDVGCGAGASLAFFKEQGFAPLGMDRSPVLLAEAQCHGPVVLGDAHALPFASGSFEGIFCECVVSLLDKAEVFFSESRRVLEDGGWLVVSDITRMPRVASPSSCSILSACSTSLASSSARLSSSCFEADDDPMTPSLVGSGAGQSTTESFPEKNCLGGAKSRQAMAQLFEGQGFVMRHVLDYRRSLVELAAKMVWEFGSMEAFWELWQQKNTRGCVGTPCAKQFGYELFIGQKQS